MCGVCRDFDNSDLMGGKADYLGGLAEVATEGREALHNVGWLSRMPLDFREAMLGDAFWRIAKPGAEFIHAGDRNGGMFSIARGSAKIALDSGHPDAPFIHLAHPGFWGGIAPLLGRPRKLNVTACDQVLWALVPLIAIRRMLGAHPEWWRHVAHLAADDTEMCFNAVADHTHHKSERRVICVLLRLGGCRIAPPKPHDPIELQITQGELAAISTMSRSTLSAILTSLAGNDLIKIHYRGITLINPQALRDLAAIE